MPKARVLDTISKKFTPILTSAESHLQVQLQLEEKTIINDYEKRKKKNTQNLLFTLHLTMQAIQAKQKLTNQENKKCLSLLLLSSLNPRILLSRL